jgi:hypothetical protein
MHLLISRGQIDTHLIGPTKLWKDYQCDNTMNERLKMSWRMDISTCQEGTQTNVTLAARIKSLQEQVVLRNLGFKERGEPEIELPILTVADNHITRYGAEVQISRGANPIRD